MKNIFLIIQREYLTRVRKKSFIVMTILGPLLMTLLYAGIIWAGMSSAGQKTVDIVDQNGSFKGKFESTSSFVFNFKSGNLDSLKKNIGDADALVFIPQDIFTNPKGVSIYSEKGVSMDLQSKIENTIEKEIESINLSQAGIDQNILKSAKVKISAQTISLKDGDEKKSSATAASIIGGVAGFLIYFTVMIYGSQVMRSVNEEKTSRIVEVLISSVKPFELMLGKIIGVALVGLTQFGLWIVLTFALTTAGTAFFGSKLSGQEMSQQIGGVDSKELTAAMQETGVMADIINSVNTLPIGTIIVCFIMFFIGGYMIYSSLFGAIGSAVDNEADTQQFMMPIMLPIIAAFAIAQFVVKDPHSSLAFWTSMFPLTSPIIMMVRIPFGVPTWEILLSIGLLIAGFIFTTWLASRIYRIGILMYGKKVSWKELGKWLFYKG